MKIKKLKKKTQHSGIHVTKVGAFKSKGLSAGDVTPQGNMPDIFKVERVLGGEGEEPKFLIQNEDGRWKAELPWSQAPKALLEMMVDRNKIYIVATPEAGGLAPQYIISGQDW